MFFFKVWKFVLIRLVRNIYFYFLLSCVENYVVYWVRRGLSRNIEIDFYEEK